MHNLVGFKKNLFFGHICLSLTPQSTCPTVCLHALYLVFLGMVENAVLGACARNHQVWVLSVEVVSL